MVAYIDGFRSTDGPFDVVHFEAATRSRSAQDQQLVASYADVGLTSWIETIPFDSDQFDHARQTIRAGPHLDDAYVVV
jgi:hypothetical protein